MNNLHIKLYSHFGGFCDDGDHASIILSTIIDPKIDLVNKIVLDFEGVRNINSSFANSLISNIIIQNGPGIIDKLQFKNCNEKIKSLIEVAVHFGIKGYSKKKFA